MEQNQMAGIKANHAFYMTRALNPTTAWYRRKMELTTIIVDPPGIKNPLYSSSRVTRWGTAIGSTIIQRIVSNAIAWIYTKSS